jgi:4-amino-4-deoxy-L-arabinose transferase-like glycosyltransferase
MSRSGEHPNFAAGRTATEEDPLLLAPRPCPDRAPWTPDSDPGGVDPHCGALSRPGVARVPEAASAGKFRRVLRGAECDPAWVRPALFGLLAATAVLYLWGLGASGWANSFYSAAVQAGTRSWKALFFGSFDSSNFITVDKPPTSLWIMELSARIFGVNAWSILVPQALEGVATVALLYASVRRWFAPAAALLAGGVLALTPVATLMFRFNNPDALLTLLLTAAAYATIRALEDGRTRWLVLAGSLIGFGFITKMLQALILVPVIALVYALAGPPKLGRRIVQVFWSGLAVLVAGGWWVAAVELTPTTDRPYVGGSSDNNLLNLVFGYNGFGRLTGNETGSVGGNGGPGSMWGPTGWNRLFLTSMGGQISWLIPAALVGVLGALWIRRRESRTDRVRAAFLLFGGWLVLTGAVFSFAQGIIHPYYTIALAPAIGALIGMGGWLLLSRRHEIVPRLTLAVAIVATVVWAFVVLGWSPSWYPPLRWVLLFSGICAAVLIVVRPRARRGVVAIVTGIAVASILAGPAAYSIDTAATAHSGAIPSAGPAVRQDRAGGPPGGFAGGGLPGGGPSNLGAGASSRGIAAFPGRSFGGIPGGLPGGPVGGFRGGGGAPQGGPPGGGLLNGSTPGAQISALLKGGASKYAWVAAITGANSASGYQLATDDPVMAIGGFNGTDPTPTLVQFERYVAEGKIHYYIEDGFGFGGGGFGSQGGAGTSPASQIASWVSSHFTSRTVDGVTLYDLTAPIHST